MLTETDRLRDFPSLAGMTYLNTAAEGIPPLAVREALLQYFGDKQLGMDGRQQHAAEWEAARVGVAELYGLSPAEISICSCASEAFNLAALALQLKTGDEVVINDLDFPAGATPWLQPTCPATVKIWRSRAGALRVDDLAALLGPKTRLVTTSLVSFFNGYMIPLPEVVDTIRRHSPALIAVDVTQALGRVPLAPVARDQESGGRSQESGVTNRGSPEACGLKPGVSLTGVDLIVSSTHKWILSSHGGGLVGVPAASADRWYVPAGGWFHLHDAFGAGRFDRAVSKSGAAGFAVGMPNYPAIYAIRAGVDYIRRIGVAEIHAAAQPLVGQCLEGVSKLAVELLTPRNAELAGIIAFRHPKADAISQRLRSKNIHIMSHAGRLRVAIHGYNTPEEIETLLRELTAAIREV